MEQQYNHLNFGLSPIFDKKSSILILGSFPSVKSRNINFYYGHPQNRFWRVLSNIFDVEINDKGKFVLNHRIALWDVIESCDIKGSSDSSITNVKVNDILMIVNNSNITKIYTNGKVAQKLYDKYLKNVVGIEAVNLPSTSPANAIYTLDKLSSCWKIIKKNI
jgi:hypoxanthine-DNA glycosylase